ncbi:MAG: site-2 protease family protein [Candidatus Aenigmarchaeota archaeon]|nr:site-2 protease family protein [Candidatus Aenigmarchaeota archaeon]
MNDREIKDLVISWLVISIIFIRTVSDNLNVDILLGFLYSLVLVGITFVFHELAHRTVARKYGAFAEYRMWLNGIVFALILALISGGRVIFAAPGAVYISALKVLRWKGEFTSLRNQDYGVISAAGPLTNLIIAGIFLILNSIYPLGFFEMATYINIFIAFFNLLPIPPLDGAKVMAWDRKVWLALFIVALIGWIGFL